jgi:hypothetical protein
MDEKQDFGETEKTEFERGGDTAGGAK